VEIVMSNREPSNAIVKAGERLTPKAVAAIWKNCRVELTVKTTVVQSKSGLKWGQWMCADCGAVFANNMQMWGHPKKHRIGWWTGTHLEEP
jgi:hypothetical protein